MLVIVVAAINPIISPASIFANSLTASSTKGSLSSKKSQTTFVSIKTRFICIFQLDK